MENNTKKKVENNLKIFKNNLKKIKTPISYYGANQPLCCTIPTISMILK